MGTYQTARYTVTREPAGDGSLYVVTGPSGRIYGHPVALRAAIEQADMYQADDDAEATQERAAARDG